jgi:hypothetical protein
MLHRLTLGLLVLACAAAVAACSSGNTTVPSSGGQPGIGPNFTTNTVYVSNTTQNAIAIYTPSPAASATPQYQIGGSNTTLNGPAYLAFDSSKRLYVTNYSAASKASSILIFQTFATGNVLPFGSVSLPSGVQPHGIAMMPSDAGVAVAFTFPGGFFSSFVNLYGAFTTGSLPLSSTIAGSNTQLNNPIGVAFDANKNLYVANSGSTPGTITVYAIPSPSPTPSGSPTSTPTPTPTPTSTPTSSGSPSASPSPTPTPSSLNIAPTTTITCACLKTPAGLTLDGNGNVYVTDPASKAVYEFAASGIVAGPVTLAPLRTLTAPTMADPMDVKVDSAGTIYVVDAGAGPNTSVLFIFPANATTPSTSIALPAGTATGVGLSP